MQQQANGYKALLIIYMALLAGQIAFAGVAVFLVQQNIFRPGMRELENIFLPMAVILALVCIVAGNKIFKNRTQNSADQEQPLAARFSDYRAVSILRWAMLEGPCLFAIISFMLTANYLFLLIAGLLLVVFGSSYPSKNKVSAQLGIDADDLDSIS